MEDVENLANWYQSSLGRFVYELEAQELNQLLPNIHGYFAVQLGGPCHMQWLKNCTIDYHAYCSPSQLNGLSDSKVRCAYTELPFAENSVDLMIMPHTLELCSDPKMVIKQASISLLSSGCMIIIGFNPHSLWGIYSKLHKNKGHLPWSLQLHSYAKLRNWLESNQMIIESYHTRYYGLPNTKNKGVEHLNPILDTMGKICLPHNGGIYILLARKRIVPLTFNALKYQVSKVVPAKVKIAEPTTKNLNKKLKNITDIK